MPANDLLPMAHEILIDGTPVETGPLRQLTIERGWSAADRLELEFDGDEPRLPTASVGSVVKVSVSDPLAPSASLVSVFDGEVVAHTVRWRAGEHRVVVEAFDRRHKLTRRIEAETHVDVKLGDIVSKIAGAHGLSANVPSTLSKTKFDFLIVADTDFAVLQGIARRTGSVWTVEDGTITFRRLIDDRGPTVQLGSERLVDFDLRYTPVERPQSVEVRSWDQKQAQTIVGTGRATGVGGTPSQLSNSTLSTDAAKVWRSGAVDVSDANEIAQALARRMRASEIHARGTTPVNPNIAPGVALEISGVSPTVNGTYIVESVVHRMGGPFQSAITEFRIGGPSDSLGDVLAQPDHGLGQAPPGVTIGIVTHTQDPEGLGRVRLKLPLLSDKVQTGWVRVAAIGSGARRGVMFVPEVKDEVLVVFEHGDLNRPYVIGSVWNNSEETFKDIVADSTTKERQLASRLGSRMRFIDAQQGDDKSGIVLEMDNAKTRIFLGYREVTIETRDRPLKITNGRASITLDKDDIAIKGQNISIEASGDMTITAQRNVTVKGNANVALDAGVELSAKAKAAAVVQSGGVTQVKGPVVQVN